MADVALRRFQVALEGPYTAGNGPLSTAQASIYNATGANVGSGGAIGTSGSPPYPATRRLSIEKGVGADFEYVWEAPVEARGAYSGAYQHILHQVMAKGKMPAYVYPDDLTWLGKMLFSGSPVVTTLPNSPVSLLASAAIPTAAGAVTITGITQPANPQIIGLQITYGTSSATSQTITVTGTVNGVAGTTEAVTFNAGSQTIFYNPTAAVVGAVSAQNWETTTQASSATVALLYTKNYFSNISSITTGASAPASSTLAVTGINAFQWVFPLDMATSTLYSATAEYYDGTGAWQLPGVVADKFTLTASIGKALKAEIDFSAKNKLPLTAYVSSTGTAGVGVTVGSISSGATAGTQQCLGNLTDSILPAIPTYLTRVYVCNLGVDPTVAANTTQINARLTDYKFSLDNKVKLGKAADGTSNPNFVGRDYYGESLNATFCMLFNSNATGSVDPGEVTQFFNLQSRTLSVSFPGIALPCGALSATSSWPYQLTSTGAASGNGGYYGAIINLGGKYTKITEKEVEGRMALDFELNSEVDLTAMQTPATITLVNRVAPGNAF